MVPFEKVCYFQISWEYWNFATKLKIILYLDEALVYLSNALSGFLKFWYIDFLNVV